MDELKKPMYLTDIIDDFTYYAKCIEGSNNIPLIVGTLISCIHDFCSEKNISCVDLEGFAVRAFDRLYRRLMLITAFDKHTKIYFEQVISELWKALAGRGVRMFYVLDNSLREDRFKLTCEAFSLTGIAVVTPYSRKFKDESDGLFDLFDSERAKNGKRSTAFAIEYLIAPMGYCPEGHYLELDEVERLIRQYMKSGKMIAYIEKDATVNYLEKVMQIGKTDDYIQIFRNKASDDGEFAVSGKNFKDKATIVLDSKAP